MIVPILTSFVEYEVHVQDQRQRLSQCQQRAHCKHEHEWKTVAIMLDILNRDVHADDEEQHQECCSEDWRHGVGYPFTTSVHWLE